MKVFILCNSDVLGVHLIHHVNAQHELVGIGVPQQNEQSLRPLFKRLGVDDKRITEFNKSSFNHSLNDLLANLSPDLLISVTFPWLIPVEYLSKLTFGGVNFHFGELPKYAGTDPIFWTIKNNESKTGITVHKIESEIDRGGVLLFSEVAIVPGMNYGMLAQRLSAESVGTFEHLVEQMTTGELAISEAENGEHAYFNAPTSIALEINWQGQGADEIESLINAANPRYGGASTVVRSAGIKIYEVSPVDYSLPDEETAEPGEVVFADIVYGLIVKTKDAKFLKIGVVQMNEGFFSGNKLFSLGFKKGDKFGI